LGEENKWYCGKCKDFVQANKSISIYKAAKYLVIHLKRFKDQKQMMFRSKLNTFVDYPFELNLEKYVINKNTPGTYD
jgi:ubiquitin C-terminal hydrolase